MATQTGAQGADAGAAGYSLLYRNYILVLLTLVYITNYADRSILAILIKPIKDEFNLSYGMMGALSGIAFAIFYTTAGLPIALMADRYNRTYIMTAAATLWSVFTALCGVVTNAWQLFFARIGVGIGEAGGSPPAHSIISDLYPARYRATALAVYATGVPLGFAVGSISAGFIAQDHGWRMAFLALGIPGLVLAALVFLTVREPPRGMSDHGPKTAVDGPAPTLRSVINFMLSQRALLHVIIGATVVTTVGYVGVTWNATFLQNSHDMNLKDAATYIGLVAMTASTAGTFCGGLLADWLGKRDRRWNSWIVALAFVIGLPVSAFVYTSNDTHLVTLLIPVPVFVAGAYLGPTFAMVQNLVGPRMRSLASGLLLFVINLVGMGAGPWVAGELADYFTGEYGVHALRHAMFLMSFLSLWGVFHYWRAGRYLETGYQRALTA